MERSFIIGLLQNVAVLLAIALLFDYVWIRNRRQSSLWFKFLNGILLGGVGIVIMSSSWILSSGIIFDTRSILLSVSGLFFGLIPTVIAMIITSVYRILEGGDGMWMGIAVIFTSGAIGIAWRNFRPSWYEGNYLRDLSVLGLLVHLVMLACTTLLPHENMVVTLKIISIPVLIFYPLGTIFLGMILVSRIRNWEMRSKLKESEERWQFALEGSGDGLWDWDAVTNKVYFSVKWKSMLGYSDDEIENRLEEWEKRVHPDDIEKTKSDLQKHLLGETPVYINEHRLLCKDGNYKWILDRGKVITRADDGKPLRVIGTHSDISERKKWEEEIFSNEQKLRIFVEYSPVAIAMLDKEMNFIVASKRYLQDYEIDDKDIAGQSYYKLMPEDKGRWEEIHNRCLSGETEKSEKEPFSRKNGRIEWIRWEIHPWYNHQGKVNGIIFFSEVITEKVIVAEKLAESSLKLESAVQASNTGLWDWDLKTNKVYFSKEWKKQIGYEDAEITDDFSEWRSRVHPDDLEKTEKKVNDFIKNPNLDYDIEFRFRHKDGTYRWILAKSSIISDEKGNPVRMVGSHLDITSHKKIEEKIRQLNETLENRVAERTKELEIKNAELERFNDLFVGREFRIKELKDLVKELQQKLENK